MPAEGLIAASFPSGDVGQTPPNRSYSNSMAAFGRM